MGARLADSHPEFAFQGMSEYGQERLEPVLFDTALSRIPG
jgi:hypothetical protein